MQESERAAFSADAQNQKSNALLVQGALANLAKKVEEAGRVSASTKWATWLAVVFSGIAALAAVAALFKSGISN